MWTYMLAPLKWLKEYTDIDCDAHELARKMTFTGTKAEGVTELGGEIQNVVVGRLLTFEKHPNADKLFVSQVDVGKGGPVQIVTGASNIKAGDVVPIALDKSMLPGGVRIKTAKMRGVESQGMMCSIDELKLSKSDYPEAPEDGIFVIDPELPPGMDIREALGLDDAVVDFEITTNRPDCLSILGLAREAAATFHAAFTPPKALAGGFAPKPGGSGARIGDIVKVEIRNPELCYRYTARAAVGVAVGDSPGWMKQRLRNCGIRPINNIVDVTNYVMLETGQPLHAFDARFIGGGEIVVRNAAEGEAIRTLDGGERALGADMLVIADSARPVAVAGVMGGEDSGILPDTKTVIIEAANFNGVSVRQTARKLGMRTESSSRFEKGLDPDMTLAAADRAAELIEALGAGTAADGVIDLYPNKRAPARVSFSPERINARLGTNIGREEMLEIFKSVELEYDEARNEVIAPSFRMDISMEADLSEEVARFYDYNNIQATLRPGAVSTIGMRTRNQKLRQTVLNTVAACGYSEIYTFSFQNPKAYDRLRLPPDSPLRNAVRLANPINEDNGLMRTTALPDMLKTMSDNYSQRNASAAFFEIASVYEPAKAPGAYATGTSATGASATGAYVTGASATDDGASAGSGAGEGGSGGGTLATGTSATGASATGEYADICGGISKVSVAAADAFLPSQKTELSIGAYGAGSTFFTMKGALEVLLDALDVTEYEFATCTDMPFMHPGRAARISVAGASAGYFGELHPDMIGEFSLPEHALAGSLSLDSLFAASKPGRRPFKQLPKYPPAPRDLSLVADAGTTAGEIIGVIKKHGGQSLESVGVFDVYTGAQVPEGKKSIALSLVFRSDERTLTDDEVAAYMAAIVGALDKEAHAALRLQ